MCRISLNFDIFIFVFLWSAKKNFAEKSKQNYIESQSKGKAMHAWDFFWHRVDKTTKYSFHFLWNAETKRWRVRLCSLHTLCALLILLLFFRKDCSCSYPLCHFHHRNVNIHLFYCHVNGLAKCTLHRTIHRTVPFGKHKRNQEGKNKVDSQTRMVFWRGMDTKMKGIEMPIHTKRSRYVGCKE